jgi:ribosome biogenesis GTPase A
MASIQWYPGHIAKAERRLKDQLKRVDVVLEVLDARIPLASQHPNVPEWIGDKARVLVLNRGDMIPEPIKEEWFAWFKARGETIYFTNAKQGQGVKVISKVAQAAGIAMNQRRRDRGMLPRGVRAVVIGFPNVGKSALINRLLGQKVVASARRAGVTRDLRWIRISEDLELLDAPGVIPANMNNQENAVKLAICEDIGEAAYVNQQIAADLVDLLVKLNYDTILTTRYHLDPLDLSGEVFIEELGAKRFKGDKERGAVQLLNDFRKGLLGSIPLELPPVKT